MKKHDQYLALLVCFLLVLLQVVKPFQWRVEPNNYLLKQSNCSIYPLHYPHTELDSSSSQPTHSVVAPYKMQGGLGPFPPAQAELYHLITYGNTDLSAENNRFLKEHLSYLYPSHHFW